MSAGAPWRICVASWLEPGNWKRDDGELREDLGQRRRGVDVSGLLGPAGRVDGERGRRAAIAASTSPIRRTLSLLSRVQPRNASRPPCWRSRGRERSGTNCRSRDVPARATALTAARRGSQRGSRTGRAKIRSGSSLRRSGTRRAAPQRWSAQRSPRLLRGRERVLGPGELEVLLERRRSTPIRSTPPDNAVDVLVGGERARERTHLSSCSSEELRLSGLGVEVLQQGAPWRR